MHVLGAVSSPAIANYALKQTVINVDCSLQAKYCVEKNFYVDDFLKSVNSEPQALKLINEIIYLLKKSGFDLTGFVSNSRYILKNLTKDNLRKSLKTIDITCEHLPTDHALGVVWHTELDTLGFKLKVKEGLITKRSILSTIFSVYDPLGLVTPILIPAKSIFQEACRRRLSWDEIIERSLANQWKN